MNTITVWLLIALSSGYEFSNGAVPAATLGQFPAAAECQRVASVIRESSHRPQAMRCIQATVVRP